jgi:hypothetical protein
MLIYLSLVLIGLLFIAVAWTKEDLVNSAIKLFYIGLTGATVFFLLRELGYMVKL